MLPSRTGQCRSDIEVNGNTRDPVDGCPACTLHDKSHENLFSQGSAAECAVVCRRIRSSRPVVERHDIVPMMRRAGPAPLPSHGIARREDFPAPASFGDSEAGGVPEWSKAPHSPEARIGGEELNLSNRTLTLPAPPNVRLDGMAASRKEQGPSPSCSPLFSN